MPKCQECKEEVDEVHAFKVGGKRRKLCEDCLEIAEEQAEIAAHDDQNIQTR